MERTLVQDIYAFSFHPITPIGRRWLRLLLCSKRRSASIRCISITAKYTRVWLRWGECFLYFHSLCFFHTLLEHKQRDFARSYLGNVPVVVSELSTQYHRYANSEWPQISSQFIAALVAFVVVGTKAFIPRVHKHFESKPKTTQCADNIIWKVHSQQPTHRRDIIAQSRIIPSSQATCPSQTHAGNRASKRQRNGRWNAAHSSRAALQRARSSSLLPSRLRKRCMVGLLLTSTQCQGA